MEWASAKRLPLLQVGKEVSFELPCAVLEAHGDERVCGDYQHRPAACRAFECKVFSGYVRGDLSRAEAFDTVKTARALITSVEERLAGATIYKDLPSKLAALVGAFEHGSHAERAANTETLLDLGILRSVVEDFHVNRAPPTSASPEAATLVARAVDPKSWKRLFAPFDDDLLAASPRLAVAGIDEEIGALRAEGYARLGSALSSREATTLATAVSALEEQGWPPVFLFMHPAVWEIPRRLEPWLGRALGDGFEMLSAFWAWDLAPGPLSQSWCPQRDRPDAALGEDGTPDSITIWIALTNATPEGGCVYVLPPDYDPHYRTSPHRVDVHDVQNIRALPAKAGVALAWNHRLLHWGGRVDRLEPRPRASVSFEFRRAGTLDAVGAMDWTRAPTFDERLRLIATQILRYKRFGGVDDRLLLLAARLSGTGEIASEKAHADSDVAR